MNKEQFKQLIDMGFTVSEALDLLKPAQPEEPKTEPAPEPLPQTETKTETPDKDPEAEAPQYVTAETFLASQKAVFDSIDKLTKAVQMNNIRSMGTDEDPTVNRADEFIANIIKGGK